MDLFAGRAINIDAMMARLRQVAEEEGLSLGVRDKTYNSRLAQELGKWAEDKGKGDAFHKAAFHAYFADGINIAKIPELVGLAENAGLPGEEARETLETRAYKEAVDLDWQRSRMMGVTAVPTFFVDKLPLVGAQPYDVMERFLKQNGVQRRS